MCLLDQSGVTGGGFDPYSVHALFVNIDNMWTERFVYIMKKQLLKWVPSPFVCDVAIAMTNVSWNDLTQYHTTNNRDVAIAQWERTLKLALITSIRISINFNFVSIATE